MDKINNSMHILDTGFSARLKKGLMCRIDSLLELCKGRSVLNIGCLCHSNWERQIHDGTWLHGQMAEVADSIIGIDYLKVDIKRIKRKYPEYEVIYGDATRINCVTIEGKYDLIICGELIEHLGNPEAFLTGIKRLMHAKSMLVITTPNPWWLRRINILYANSEEFKLNPEHVMWYSYWTLKRMLERYDYSEVAWGWYRNEREIEIRGIPSVLSKFVSYFTPAKMQRGLFFISKLNKAELF